MADHFVNISGYKFVELENLQNLRTQILEWANQLKLKGTVLLASEGINLFVAGLEANIDEFVSNLRTIEELKDFEVKKSPSDHQPFSRMLVRIKKEIIAFGVDSVQPARHTSEKITAETLKSWLDAGRDVALLDVRNDYEVEVGTFANAIPIGVDHFRDFPKAVDQLPEDTRRKPLVMFCTGGIRCEKAGPYMEQRGFDHVYQLDGGILKYFEDVGGDHWDGECFVFDKRVAVDPELNETPTTQCYACQHPLSSDDQQDARYNPPQECPYCFRTEEQKMANRIAERQVRLAKACDPLPGSVPYDNIRPLNVPARFDGFQLLDFLCEFHPHIDRTIWQQKIADGRIRRDKQPVEDETRIVRGGERWEHLIPQQTEPDVNAGIEIVYEDDDLVFVNKPAPLPMHPCGRFNRNTLVHLLNEAYETQNLRIVHRLDSDTTGIVVLARKGRVARQLHEQFKTGDVEKSYLALTAANPVWEREVCTIPISNAPGESGSRTADESGLAAKTEFTVLRRDDDGSALLKCVPVSGRTNQIRIHCAELGCPIKGDSLYGNGKAQEESRLHLHALSLSLTHPTTGKRLTLETTGPDWAPKQM